MLILNTVSLISFSYGIRLGFFIRLLHKVKGYKIWKLIPNFLKEKSGISLKLENRLRSWVISVKVCPHLYANANKACRSEANANECQIGACSAFATQANEQVFRWSFVGCPNEYTSTSVRLRTYFSLKYRLQMDSVRLLVEHTPHKQMKANAVCLHVYIMHFAFTYRCGRSFLEMFLNKQSVSHIDVIVSRPLMGDQK